MATKILCPYCFSKFDNSEALYQCENEERTPDGDYKCERVTSREYDEFWGMQDLPIRHMWPNKRSLFSRLNFEKKKCPECGYRSGRFVCPHCHNPLPSQMIEKGSDIISVIGGPNSGKTNYIISLIHQLRKYGYTLDLQVIPSESHPDHYEPTTKRYDKMHTELFANKRVLAKTPPRAYGQKEMPWIFVLTQNSTGKQTFLVFYDSAGELFLENIHNNARYVEESSAVIVLLDTLSIKPIQEVMEKKAGQHFSFSIPIDQMAKAFGNFLTKEGKDFTKKPTAFVFSKFDSVLENSSELEFAREEFVDGDKLLDSSYLQTGKLDLRKINAISSSIERALNDPWKNDDGASDTDFLQLCENWESEKNKKRSRRPAKPQYETPGEEYKDPNDPDNNYKLFGVSSFGCMPDKRGELEKVKPYRVTDPLIWILYKLGQFKIPVK